MTPATTHELVLRGRVSARLLRPLLDDFTVDHGTAGVTRLVGPVIDACHLHGVLAHLTSVGVELVSLGPLTPSRAEPDPPDSPIDLSPGAHPSPSEASRPSHRSSEGCCQPIDRPRTAGARTHGRTTRPVSVAVVLAAGLLVVVAFQAALVAGAPWGAAAWGGYETGRLPTELRVGSVFQAAFYTLATLTVLSRGGVIRAVVPHFISRRAIWVLTAVLAIGAVTNAASPSGWERFGWAPFVLGLAVLCFRLARSPLDMNERRAERGRLLLDSARYQA
jgi:hypothetical protein